MILRGTNKKLRVLSVDPGGQISLYFIYGSRYKLDFHFMLPPIWKKETFFFLLKTYFLCSQFCDLFLRPQQVSMKEMSSSILPLFTLKRQALLCGPEAGMAMDLNSLVLVILVPKLQTRYKPVHCGIQIEQESPTELALADTPE